MLFNPSSSPLFCSESKYALYFLWPPFGKILCASLPHIYPNLHPRLILRIQRRGA